MEPDAILTRKEADEILTRLRKLSGAAKDIRTKEQIRLASCVILKGRNRAARERRKTQALLDRVKAITEAQ